MLNILDPLVVHAGFETGRQQDRGRDGLESAEYADHFADISKHGTLSFHLEVRSRTVPLNIFMLRDVPEAGIRGRCVGLLCGRWLALINHDRDLVKYLSKRI